MSLWEICERLATSALESDVSASFDDLDREARMACSLDLPKAVSDSFAVRLSDADLARVTRPSAIIGRQGAPHRGETTPNRY